jgi:hypothetical protein
MASGKDIAVVANAARRAIEAADKTPDMMDPTGLRLRRQIAFMQAWPSILGLEILGNPERLAFEAPKRFRAIDVSEAADQVAARQGVEYVRQAHDQTLSWLDLTSLCHLEKTHLHVRVPPWLYVERLDAPCPNYDCKDSAIVVPFGWPSHIPPGLLETWQLGTSRLFDAYPNAVGVPPKLKYECIERRVRLRLPANVGPQGWAARPMAAHVANLGSNDRLHIEDIDNFVRVRGVRPDMVARFLKEGYFDKAEDAIQLALESILNVPFHKKDWSGEENDVYTANVVTRGRRIPTAFMLKGNGLKSHTMLIKHCGKNSDQVIRLFRNPAELFVIQFVGNISEAVIQQAQSEIARLKGEGKKAQFLIMDGQDTARLMLAYGMLK